MTEDRIPSRRRALLPLLLTPFLASAFDAKAQNSGVRQDRPPRQRHDDPVWFMPMRPQESQGLKRLEIYHRTPAQMPHTSQAVYEEAFRAAKVVLTPDDQRWSTVIDAYWKTTFSLCGDGAVEFHWVICAYTDRGLSRVFMFLNEPYPGDKALKGLLDSDAVFVHGPLPDLLRQMMRKGELNFGGS